MAQKQFTDSQLARGRRKLIQFHQWRYDNPRAYEYGVSYALACHENGQHVGGSGIVEAIRSKDFTDEHGNPTRTNNDYAPIIARLIVVEHPHMRGSLEMRSSVYDAFIPTDTTDGKGCDANCE